MHAALPEPRTLKLDAGVTLAGESALQIAVDLFAPPPGATPRALLWCLPGGNMNRRYYDLIPPSAAGAAIDASFSFARTMAANGSGPQPVIEGTPAEVALNPDAAGGEQPDRQRHFNGNHANGEGEGGQRRPRRQRRGGRPRDDGRDDAQEARGEAAPQESGAASGADEDTQAPVEG